MARHLISLAIALAAAALAGGCSSRDQDAAAAAAAAASAMDSGNLPLARQQIGRALALRDDVSDYWLQLAQIAIQTQDYAAAFDAYENVVTLDSGNVEALRLLCQIALSANAPQRAERYADQLAVLRPDDPLSKTVRAALALSRGDKASARTLLDEVLATAPDDIQALLVKSRLLMTDDDLKGAAQALEKSLAAPGDPTSRLIGLKDLYRRSGSIADYDRTVALLARASPDAAAPQIDYAATLYDAGDPAAAFAVTRRVLETHPDDIAAAASVLDLWLVQGSAAMPIDAIAAAANLSLEARATFGQYANEIGRPDLAQDLLSADAPGGGPTPTNSDAKAAFAYAIGLTGQGPVAQTILAQVLLVDASQPRALLARARLRARSGDLSGAIADARQVVADDAGNAAARLTLADLLLRQNQSVLAETVLRQGMNLPGAAPQLAERLAAMLRKQGRGDDAAGALADFARANPVSRRAKLVASR
jgi:tetratricopeptide (TPR) repeat protein